MHVTDNKCKWSVLSATLPAHHCAEILHWARADSFTLLDHTLWHIFPPDEQKQSET